MAGTAPAPPVAAIVVAYRPDPQRLARLLARLAPQVDTLYLVDNADEAPARSTIEAAAVAAGAVHVPMGGNAGIAAAQNRGLDAAARAGHRFALLSDDDSLPPADLVPRLVDGLVRAQARGERVAAVGPLVGDTRDAAATLVFRHTWIGPRRVPRLAACDAGVPGGAPDDAPPPFTGAPPEPAPIDAAFLVASGCLIDLGALPAIGGMREDLFIDHVDLEWGLRARRAGWRLLVLPQLRLAHRLGDRLVRLPLPGGRPVHVHGPVRNYYLARNTLLLMRAGLLPPGWRLGYLLWLAKYLAFHLAFVAPRAERLRMFARGLRDGLAGRGGPIRPAACAGGTHDRPL